MHAVQTRVAQNITKYAWQMSLKYTRPTIFIFVKINYIPFFITKWHLLAGVNEPPPSSKYQLKKKPRTFKITGILPHKHFTFFQPIPPPQKKIFLRSSLWWVTISIFRPLSIPFYALFINKKLQSVRLYFYLSNNIFILYKS